MFRSRWIASTSRSSSGPSKSAPPNRKTNGREGALPSASRPDVRQPGILPGTRRPDKQWFPPRGFGAAFALSGRGRRAFHPRPEREQLLAERLLHRAEHDLAEQRHAALLPAELAREDEPRPRAGGLEPVEEAVLAAARRPLAAVDVEPEHARRVELVHLEDLGRPAAVHLPRLPELRSLAERTLGEALDALEALHPLAHAVDVDEPRPHPLGRSGDRDLDLAGERHRRSLRAGTIPAGPGPARKALLAQPRADNVPA